MAGAAAAHSPNAPSTCSQASWVEQASAIGSNASNAPVATLPAWAQTIVGPSAPASASPQRRGIHPALVVGGDADRRVGAESKLTQGGVDGGVGVLAADNAHRRCTDESVVFDVPADLREYRVAGGGQTCGVGALPTRDKADARGRGRPSRSSVHADATSSIAAAAGDREWNAAHWSHAETTQSAASAAGTAPPITKPKWRGPALATRPGSAPATKRVDDGRRVLARLRQRSTERTSHTGGIHPGGHRALIKSAEELQCVGAWPRKDRQCDLA